MNYSNEDDFASLVSRSNPAAQQPRRASYAQAGPSSGYPPSHQPQPAPSIHTTYEMDPFFDDEDEQMPQSAGIGTFSNAAGPGRAAGTSSFGGTTLIDGDMDSTTDLPLTKSAMPPAGILSREAKQPNKDWTFDDDDVPASLPTMAPSRPPTHQPTKRRFQWKWPWEKKKLLSPERKIWLNDRFSNEAEGYCNNYVSTSKYNLVTFVPKFLGGTHRAIYAISSGADDDNLTR